MFTGIILYTTSSGNTILMDTGYFLSEYSIIAAAELLLLLSFRAILSVSNLWGEFLKNSLNMGIFPLLLSFSWIIIYTVLSML